jgi:ABC-type transport system substrate-binding protein
MRVLIGTRLADRYEVVGELGRGGMGVVYRAKDPVLNREVAIKLIPPGNLTTNAEERFLREAQIVAQMDHPAIVPIYDLGRHEGALFFVMPVLPGTNLRHLLRDGSLRLGDVLDIGTQVAEALDYSHARGIVHRDIKPENVMTARENGGHVRARVMDFGLALATTEDRLTKTGTLVGTVSYFSPEQVTSRSFDGRSDTYALATVLYECLAGEPPFSGEVQTILYRIVHELPQSLTALGVDVGEELESVLFQCLEKDPEKRPKKAAHLADALRRYRGKLHEDEYTRSVMLTASRMVTRPQAAAPPFIGREKEIAELQRRLHAAVAGECQFAVVAGEPGIGKTRLVEQLTSLARARKIRVLQGRFVEQDRAFAHQGFCELIQDYFRSKEAGSGAASRPDFSDLAPDLIALFPVLSEIGELRSAATEPGQSAAKADDKITLFELLARTLTRIAQGRPVVLVLEELHGAEQSIEALQYIVRRLAPTPTLIVATYRQTEVEKRHPLVKMLESFRGDARFVSLALGPLSASEHRSLVELTLGGGKVSEVLAARLHEATEGNPLFTKELVRSLLDSGGITKDDDTGVLGLSAAAGISSDVLPETIQQAVEARIGRLPDQIREVLAICAVLGKSFEYRDLETLAEGSDLDEAVERLVRDGLLEEEPGSRGDRLAFASGIVRDVLYGSVARRKRKLLHKKYADLLEKRHAGRLERVYPDLVHHFSQGDVPEKAVEYGLKLAQKSLSAFSPEEAARVARTVLDYVEGAEWEGEDAPEGDARLLLAQASQMAGHLDAALREAEAAAKVFEREKKPERAVAAVVFAAEAAWQARRVDETRRWAERGLEVARTLGDPAPYARLLTLAASVASMHGEHKKAAAYLAEIERIAPREREAAEMAQGGTLVVALANPVLAREPATSQTVEEHEMLANVFETLVTTDPQGNLVPLLCERWDVSKDGRTVSIALRGDVRLSDGTPLTADVVKASFERAIRLRSGELPAAFAAIRGAGDLVGGDAPHVAGLEVRSDAALDVHLLEALPIFPALLTDITTAVGRVTATLEAGGERVIGTGPFRISVHAPDRVVLERNPHSRKQPPPRLDAIEFRPSMSASSIAAALRDGTVELAHDLLPEDVDDLLREPRFRTGLVETPKKGTYMVLFNRSSPLGGNAAFRRALAGATRSQDFVWGALGRFALPATGLIPPGILGHDAGRRRSLLPREAALDLLQSAGLVSPIRLMASVHPLLQDRFRALTSALFDIWRELGVEVSVATSNMSEFLEMQKHPAVDMQIGRWIADYDDPDDFTFGLFHSRNGHFRAFYSSPEADRLLEEARLESRPSAREGLYRRFEALLLDEAVQIPLFHEIDYRIAAPSVRGVELHSTPPFVSYGEIGKVRSPEAHRPQVGGGTLRVPIPGIVTTLDPAVADSNEQAEVVGNVFETLTRNFEGGKIVPWLASEILAEEGGTRFRFRLRRGVRFHDGRALTARDVRYSFERLLASETSQSRWLLSPVRGAAAMLNGKASELAGLRIESPSELVMELEKPVSFFPAMLSYVGLAVVPEGTVHLGDHWSQRCAGTGPFRLVRFEPGLLVELERNPGYWREGYPKSESLLFRLGVTPEEIKNEFLAGRLAVGSDLLPSDAEALRQDPRFASGYRESPRLSTYVVALNVHRAPLDDVRLRRRLAEGIDAPSLVRRTLGRLAIPASGLIPPGLLGHTAKPERQAAAAPARPASAGSIELSACVHPVFFGEYSAFYLELVRAFRELGVAIRAVNKTTPEYMAAIRTAGTDLVVGRWNGDYPDADTFVTGAIHSSEGMLGRFCGTPEIDRLAERGRAESDPSIRHALYRQVEDILARDALLIPLFHEQVYRFARPEVEGLSVGFSYPHVPYENLWIRA